MKLLVAVLSLCVAIPLHAEEVSVAAASDLSFAIKEIVQHFEKETGNKVRLTLGSSGNFYAQIVNGAPFDVFLSANTDYAKRLGGPTFVYGIGRIALWVRNDSKVDVEKLGLRALADPSVKKIAIANPEHAPYGQAAVAAMQHAGIYDHLKPKLVLGENISQAAQFVQSGAADAGIIALSIALSEPMRKSGRYWLVPQEMHRKMEQGAVLLKRGGPAARAFFEYLRSETAREVFRKYGFGEIEGSN